MGTEDESRKAKPTDNVDTAVLGQSPLAMPAGTLLNDRYLLVRQLNEGGFGTVHLAHDQQMHGRPVVVKIQINQRVEDPWFERKFSEEVRALSLLDHPGVVVAFDSGRTPDGKPFLVMQYVDGVTLRGVMTPEGMPLERAAGILKQLGDALFAAHEKGIWHRDLKPENIMLQTSTAGDRVRLIDFGIATVADAKSKYQESTRIAGSVLYMAPEQSIGQPSALTDIYAMGMIAYEMVTGRRPFPADNAIQMNTLQQKPVRVRPTDLRPSIPPAAEQLILQSLQPEPFRRPQNARAFGENLHDALVSGFTRAVALPLSAALGPDLTIAPNVTDPALIEADRKHRRRLIALAIFAIVVGGGIFRDALFPKHKPAPVETAKTAPNPGNEEAIELTFWDSVKDSTEPSLYNEYLSKYPNGRFASLAKAKMEILSRQKPSPPPVAKAAPQVAKPQNEELELALWNSVKDSKDPKLFQDYLNKYPNGTFADVARTRMAAPPDDEEGHPGGHGRGPRPGQPPPESGSHLVTVPGLTLSLPDPSNPNFRRKLPPLRPAVSLGDYFGPLAGEIHWAGRLQKNQVATIQGGEANIGITTGALPCVPVTIEVLGGQVSVFDPPTDKNHWDRLSLRNVSDTPLKGLIIHWKVIK